MKTLVLLNCSFLLFFSPAHGIHVPPWPDPYWFLVPGSYCQSAYPQLSCCSGRTDGCSVPILDTRCYCDSFCNRTGSADCCPDYFSHCEGLYGEKYEEQPRPLPPTFQRHSEDNYHEQVGPSPETILAPPADCPHGVLDISDPVCLFRGHLLRERDSVQDNCNQCKCQVSESKLGCMEVVCTSKQCMLQEEAIKEMQALEERNLYSWKPANVSEFWGKTLKEGINGKLGAEKPDISAALKAHQMSAVQMSYTPSSLPHQFISLSTWPGLISPVSDQGWCSSSWAVSAAAVAGDRTSIAQASPVVLSSQALLSCNKRGPVDCGSKQVDHAWDQLRRHGSWDSSCQSAGSPKSCPSACRRYRTLPAYRVGRGNTYRQPHRNEEDIMHEVMHQGPVQAVMEVYTDFFMYGSGIYQKINLASNTLAGYHAVRIVGWGEEGGVKFWKVANSWGTEWGEEGFFRISKGNNECLVEEFVMAVWPRKKRSRRTRGKSHKRRSAKRDSSGVMQMENGRMIAGK